MSVDVPVQLTVTSDKPDLVILIRGTWNASNFNLIENRLDSLRIPWREYSNLCFGEQTTAEENAEAIEQKLMWDIETDDWKKPSWSKTNLNILKDTKLDIIAHSFGGLVARRFAKINDDLHIGTVRNIITVGTPMGGMNGVEWQNRASHVLAACEETSSVFKQAPKEMAVDIFKKELYQDVNTGVSSHPSYWMLGGTDATEPLCIDNHCVPTNIGKMEPKPKDSVVSTRSVSGFSPEKYFELFAKESDKHDQDKDNPNLRFQYLNHTTLLTG